jgi:hypothetical protein
MDGTVEDFIGEIIEEAKVELARIGVFFEDVEELETYGNFFSTISFRCASVNLQNAELQGSCQRRVQAGSTSSRP